MPKNVQRVAVLTVCTTESANIEQKSDCLLVCEVSLRDYRQKVKIVWVGEDCVGR
jgi:hypothetical protein